MIVHIHNGWGDPGASCVYALDIMAMLFQQTRWGADPDILDDTPVKEKVTAVDYLSPRVPSCPYCGVLYQCWLGTRDESV